MHIGIRRAKKTDIPFLGWVTFTAARSHLAICPWQAIFGGSEAETRELLERICQTGAVHWCHFSRFWIAEADGKPVAALCGFRPATQGTSVLAQAALGIAATDLGFSSDRLDEVGERLKIAMSGLPDDLADAWGIENVAVLPDYRGLGLVDRLFERVLGEGREHGFSRAQILCLIGNAPGQRAWERNGFSVLARQSSPAFDHLFGTPGAMRLARNI